MRGLPLEASSQPKSLVTWNKNFGEQMVLLGVPEKRREKKEKLSALSSVMFVLKKYFWTGQMEFSSSLGRVGQP